MFKEEIGKLNIPEGFEVVVEPWPYGGKSCVSLELAIRAILKDS